jgi:hypothetical protein
MEDMTEFQVSGGGWRRIPFVRPMRSGGLVFTGLWVSTGYGAQVCLAEARDELTGGDPCPVCGVELDYDEVGDEREPEIVHPDPQCGWQPDGYPSSGRGWAHGRDPDAT